MRSCRVGMILPELHDLKSVPFLADRERILDEYAKQFVDDMHVHESLNDFCEQVSLNLGDKGVIPELKAKIRRLGFRVYQN